MTFVSQHQMFVNRSNNSEAKDDTSAKDPRPVGLVCVSHPNVVHICVVYSSGAERPFNLTLNRLVNFHSVGFISHFRLGKSPSILKGAASLKENLIGRKSSVCAFQFRAQISGCQMQLWCQGCLRNTSCWKNKSIFLWLNHSVHSSLGAASQVSPLSLEVIRYGGGVLCLLADRIWSAEVKTSARQGWKTKVVTRREGDISHDNREERGRFCSRRVIAFTRWHCMRESQLPLSRFSCFSDWNCTVKLLEKPNVQRDEGGVESSLQVCPDCVKNLAAEASPQSESLTEGHRLIKKTTIGLIYKVQK